MSNNPNELQEYSWVAVADRQESHDFPVVTAVQLWSPLNGQKEWVEAIECECDFCQFANAAIDVCTEDPKHCAICTNYWIQMANHTRTKTAKSYPPLLDGDG